MSLDIYEQNVKAVFLEISLKKSHISTRFLI